MSQIGSVGSAVAAALETAGQYMQGEMLHALDGGAMYSLGLLFYLIAAITALIILSCGGHYKHALAFLIGPPVFFFIVAQENRTTSEGARWQLGLDESRYDQRFVFKALDDVTDESGTHMGSAGNPIVVTKFFAIWNRIVSRTMESFAALVLKFGDGDSDRSFVNKTERYMRLFQEDITDPALKQLVQRELVQECGDYFRTLIYLHTPALSQSMDISTKNRLQEKVQKYEQFTRIRIKDRPELDSWLSRVGGVDPNKEEYNCKELWNVTVQKLLRDEANARINELTRNGLMAGQGIDAEKMAQIRRIQLAKKMRTSTGVKSGEVTLHEMSDEDADTLLVNEMAARMLLRQMTSLDPNIAQLRYVPDTDIRREKVGDQSADVARSIRNISNFEEWVGRGDFITAALSMPYVQGVALFFLAMMFPFFAMTIMIPARHVVFLQWMSLWVWVKSWDVGFAVVMVIDDLLYVMMPHGPPITSEALAEPGELMKTLFEVDPTYSAATYYNLIATLMLSVPVITGFLVKRGAHGITNAITNGTQRFAAKTGNAMGLFQGSLQAQSNIVRANELQYKRLNPNGSNESIGQLVNGVIGRAIDNREVTMGLLEATASNVAQGYLGTSGVSEAGTASQFAGKTKEQVMGIALARYKFERGKEVRETGVSFENRQYAASAVEDKWYSHHSIFDIPMDSYTELLKYRNTYQVGGVVGGFLSRMFNRGGTRGPEDLLRMGNPKRLPGKRAMGMTAGAVGAAAGVGATAGGTAYLTSNGRNGQGGVTDLTLPMQANRTVMYPLPPVTGQSIGDPESIPEGPAPAEDEGILGGIVSSVFGSDD